MKLKFQYGSNGPIGRQLAAWQNSLFPGYVSFRRLQFHHQNRLIISLINKGANTWIITQPPYSHNFCRSKTAINNRELLYFAYHLPVDPHCLSGDGTPCWPSSGWAAASNRRPCILKLLCACFSLDSLKNQHEGKVSRLIQGPYLYYVTLFVCLLLEPKFSSKFTQPHGQHLHGGCH